MAAVHFVVERADGREMPVCHPEGLPTTATKDMWTRSPERITCADCLAIVAGDAGGVDEQSGDGGEVR